MNDSDDDSWLKIGQTFGKKEEDKFIGKKRRAADYFSSESESESGNEKIKIKESIKRKESLSDFSSDEEKESKKATQKQKKDITKKFLTRNVFELEDKKKKCLISISNANEEVYCAEEILDALEYLSNKQKRRFLNKFELKKIKFHDSDVLFTVDIIGIKENYKYGSLQKKEIPLYFRIHTNIIFGIKNIKLSKEIIKELNEMLGIYATKSELETKKRYRYYDTNYISNFLNYGVNKTKLHNLTQFDFDKDFLPILKEKEDVKINKNEDLLDLKIDYSLFESDVERILLENNRDYHKKINEDPSNIQYWFDLINFQDELNFSKNEKAKREIKLNILEKALKNKRNEDNILLNLLHLRILEEANFDDFELVNNEWMKKFKVLSNNKKFLSEYLTFIKTRRKLNINDIRDHYLNILKLYESFYIESNEEKLLYSKFIIEILVDYICLEQMSGFYEKSFSILRSFLELNCLKIKKILKEKYFEDYVNYFENEYPKIGDFEQSLGFIHFIQKKERINMEFFNKEDFIENFRESNICNQSDILNASQEGSLRSFINSEKSKKNYRSLNFLYDKENLESNSDSFIFFSDIKDYVEIKFLVNTETMLFFLNSIKRYIGIIDETKCFSCGNNGTINYDQNYLKNMSKTILDDTNELRFLFDEKFVFYRKQKNFDPQLFFYFNRLYDYILNLNILTDEVILMKMDMIFLYKQNTEEFKFNFARNLLKDPNNQSKFKMWFNYYKWCLFYSKYDDAEKVMKVINSKHIKNDEFELEQGETSNYEEFLKIKTFSISHYMYFLLINNPKYNLEEFNSLIYVNLQFIFDNLNLGQVQKHFTSDTIEVLETVLKNNNKLSENTYLLILTLLTCLIFITSGNLNMITKSFIMSKLKLISNYVNLVEIYTKNSGIINCNHKIKQEISLIFMRIIFLLRKYNTLFSSPKFTIEILENLNNFNFKQNDIFLILMSKHLCHFSNPVDRELKFLSSFGNNLTIKHFYYFLNAKFNTSSSNPNVILNFYKNYWKINNQNLYKLTHTTEIFSDSKTITDKNLFSLSLNNKENSSTVLLYYFNDLLKMIKKEGTNELHHFLDFSLFLIHEYSYSKELYMRFLNEFDNLLNNPNLVEEQKEMIKKHINHLIDILKIKEIRIITSYNP